MRKILVFGATSAIAEATARIWAKSGDSLFLVARNSTKLESLAVDLKALGSHKVEIASADLNDIASHVALIDTAELALDGIDTVLIAHGTLPDQALCQQSVETSLLEIKTNALSVISLLTDIANRFEQAKQGTIIVISSVAGDKGRQSNYVYGSAKSLVSVFTSGLRQRLQKSGVAVVTIKPGFVDTPMTAAFKKGILWSTPEKVAKAIVRAGNKRSAIVYTPWFWLWIMLVIKSIPEFIFKRISL